MNTHAMTDPAAFAIGCHAALPASVPLRRAETLALLYLFAISAGVFGFVDVLVYGTSYTKTDASPFAQLLWPIAYVVFAGLILCHLRPVLETLRRCWWLVPFPVLACVSVLWSIEPTGTLNGAIRIGMTTAMAVLIGTRFRSADLARMLFWVLFVAVGCSVLSALAGLSFALMDDGSTARGLFTHKNTLGSRGALLFVVALALLLAGWRPLLVLSALPAAVAAVLMSRSAAGLALLAIAMVTVPVGLALRGSGIQVLLRTAIVLAVLTGLAFLVVLFRIDPVLAALDALGRDATLTGRSLLWEVALQHMADRPLLGTGFDAFWAAGIDWRTLFVLEELGNVLNFHNTFLEVGVQLGWLGLAVAVLTLFGYGRGALLALRNPYEAVPLWPALYGITIVAVGMVEFTLFQKHSLTHILLIAIPVAVMGEVARLRTWSAAQAWRQWAGSSGAQAVEAQQPQPFEDPLPRARQHQRHDFGLAGEQT